MTEEQYLSLCEKYFKGDCNPQELALLKQYQHEYGMDSDQWLTDTPASEQERLKSILKNRLYSSLHPQQTSVVSFYKWKYATVAAVALLFTAIGFYIFNANQTRQASLASQKPKSTVTDIQPGSNKAVLTLSTGKSIVLDDAKNGVLSKQGGAAISKSGNALVIKNGAKDNAGTVALNTITIPRGGKYNIVLPDGTKVWLNSSSSLIFPTSFNGNDRKVSLTGEAYFEVAKNKKMPFKIDVIGKQVVEVLGTHFNINAYADENNITTTLLEGSVKVNYKHTATLIKPGQEAINDLDKSIKVKEANIDEVMAWKNGMFTFNNENITTVMKKVSRWYDVDVTYKGDMTNIDFDGNYSRSKSLTNLLKNIELMDHVHFIIEGRRVTVIGK